MAVSADSNVLGPITTPAPALKIEVCFDTDPFPTYKDSVIGIAKGYWRLDEASGNFADSSGNGYTATAHGTPTYGVAGALAGDTDKAAEFAGTAYASTGLAVATADLAFGFSFEAWVKRSGTPAASAVIAGISGSCQLEVNTAGKLVVGYNNGSVVTLTGNTNVCDGAWHHVVGIWDTAELRVYVDGALDCTPVAEVTAAVGNANDVGIAAFADGTSPWGGYLDEVAFYLVPLTPLQVENHFISADVSVSPTWVDVTDDVMLVTTSMGEQWERDQVQAGTAQLTLDNTSRNYDPANQDSPHYPNVLPMRMIRGSVVFAGTTYWLFTGYVERWPQAWEGPSWAEVEITVVDGFEFLTQSFLDGYIAQGLSGAQIARALDIAAWSLAKRAVDAGQVTLAAAKFWPFQGSSDTDTAALSFIQQCAQSEGGVFFIAPDGTATYQDKSYRQSNSRAITSQGTFGDADDNSELLYVGLTPSFDKDRIINDARITLSDGATVEASTDKTSIRRYFRRTYALATQIANASDGLSYAQGLTGDYAEPATRFDSVVIEPLEDPDLWVQALARTISDRITVVRRPPGVGPPISQDAYIEQIQWSIRPEEPWQVTWLTSPAGPGNVFILDTSTLDGGDVLGF